MEYEVPFPTEPTYCSAMLQSQICLGLKLRLTVMNCDQLTNMLNVCVNVICVTTANYVVMWL